MFILYNDLGEFYNLRSEIEMSLTKNDIIKFIKFIKFIIFYGNNFYRKKKKFSKRNFKDFIEENWDLSIIKKLIEKENYSIFLVASYPCDLEKNIIEFLKEKIEERIMPITGLEIKNLLKECSVWDLPHLLMTKYHNFISNKTII